MSWQSSELVEREQQIARRRVLGWGAQAAEIFPGEDLGRDLVLTRNPNGRLDLALVEGMDNLAQALRRRGWAMTSSTWSSASTG
jgi:hypothetical protein